MLQGRPPRRQRHSEMSEQQQNQGEMKARSAFDTLPARADGVHVVRAERLER